MSFMRKIILGKQEALVALLALVLLVPLGAGAAVKSEECLECHDGYKDYSHNGVTCVDCHSTITSLPHAEKLPKPACAACHEKTVTLYGRSIHKEKGLDCAQCHNVHYLQKERKYCVSCHGNVTHAALPSSKKHLKALVCIACHGKVDRTEIKVRLQVKGEKGGSDRLIDREANNFIDRAQWDAIEDLLQREFKGRYALEKVFLAQGDPHTVTGKHVDCDLCHSAGGYFANAQLSVSDGNAFEVRTDPRIFIPELPSRQDFSKTVHGRAGVRCADCHLSQKRIAEGWSEGSKVCIKCHRQEEEVYSSSRHGEMGATHCVDCHNPHRIRSYKELGAKERIAVCSRCHKDYLRIHAWLPNTSLHFDYLECATCHSPRSEKSIVFYLAEKTPEGKVKLSYDRLVALYGGDPSTLMKGDRGSPSLDARIGQLLTALTERDRNVVIDASIIVTKAYHSYSETRLKAKECVMCHSAEARFYDAMFFILPGKDSTSYIPAKGSVLSTYPIGTSVDFFLLGEDKIRKNDVYKFLGLKGAQGGPRSDLGFKLIDFFALLLVVLICAGLAVHIILRIVVKR
jgi:predicted CXXCH cytochrome family protein